MRLTEHFSLEEMTTSAMATRQGLSNVPGADELENIRYTAGRMEVVRDLLGVPISVLSCFRAEAVNQAVGGSPTSAHRYGLACDFRAPAFGDVRAICRKLNVARQQGLIDFDQLICEFPDTGGWVHIGFRRSAAANRHQVLTARKENGRTAYVSGVV
ncbi:MAG: ATP-binding protein [Pseudogulbenkiania sp.]|nr:ATP-binding protein [Pseudogulbenkiania sp.]